MKSNLVFFIATALLMGCSERPSPVVPKSQKPVAPPMPLLEPGRDASDVSIALLADKLSAAVPSTRRDAALALGVAAAMDADRIPLIEGKLVAAFAKEEDKATRAALMWALSRAGTTEALASFQNGLRAGELEISRAAALGLGVLGRREVAIGDDLRTKLVELTESPDQEMQYASGYALAREHDAKEDSRVTAALAKLATSEDAETRSVAITGLGRRKTGIDSMIAALPDSDWRVSVAAVRGLLTTRGPLALGGIEGWIRASVRDDKLPPHPIRTALEGLGEVAYQPVAQRVASLVIEKLADEKLLSLDNGQILCLATAISTRGGGDIKALETCAGVSVPAWWRAGVYVEAVAASGHLTHPQRIANLSELAADKDPRVRAVAVTALAKVTTGTERAVALSVFARALEDESSAVAGSAADALGGLGLRGGEATVLHRALLERTRKELIGDGELGLTMIAAIARLRINDGIEACSIAAIHRNRSIRAAGIDCLDSFDVKPPTAEPLVREPAETASPLARGKTLWTINTSRGSIVIELEPGVAPRHVAAVSKLTASDFYSGLTFHRVVPDFVIQGGDPDGTGWGGPDFVIPAEASPLSFERGIVGIADAGPDTGGSQWFVMHSRAAHLEGRYTRIGKVIRGIEVVDQIAVGDRIESATVSVESQVEPARDER